MDMTDLQGDGAQDTEKLQTDPRAALAEALAAYPYLVGPVADRLAERGVLLVTEERLRAAVDRVIDRDDWRGNRPDNNAAAIFDALSGEVTE